MAQAGIAGRPGAETPYRTPPKMLAATMVGSAGHIYLFHTLQRQRRKPLRRVRLRHRRVEAEDR